MVESANTIYLVKAEQKVGLAEPDAIGTIVMWANQMYADGRMPEDVKAAFVAHFGFFAE